MIKGDIIFPKKIPNLNQILFKGVRILEFNKPNNMKIKEIISDHSLASSLFNNGYKPISKKTIKKTIPNDLFEGSLMLSIFDITKIV
tara:strand:+ start:136 stop:396 length:261 start_codon:yes stop_codon:yes gene_type:complete